MHNIFGDVYSVRSIICGDLRVVNGAGIEPEQPVHIFFDIAINCGVQHNYQLYVIC